MIVEFALAGNALPGDPIGWRKLLQNGEKYE